MSDFEANNPGEREQIDYLLGELPESERSEFERRLTDDPDLRDAVTELRALVVALRDLPKDGWATPEPPPLSLPLNGSVAGRFGAPGEPELEPDPKPNHEREAPPALLAPAEPQTRKRRSGRWRLGALAGAGAALLAGGIVLGSLLGGDDTGPAPTAPPTAQVVSTSDLRPASRAGRGSRGVARVLSGATEDRDLGVSVSGLPATGRGQYYELWLMRGRELISLGGFKVGSAGRRSVEVPLPVDPADYRLIDISLERANGNPGHSATSLLRGPA